MCTALTMRVVLLRNADPTATLVLKTKASNAIQSKLRSATVVIIAYHFTLCTQVKLADDSLVSGRIVVGCDGINSVCRAAVTGVANSESKARHCGEICYR
jgi:2-polyprenyl-6-methoxyphenol hydroxylase-like FAD-dependent oxidoreductase